MVEDKLQVHSFRNQSKIKHFLLFLLRFRHVTQIFALISDYFGSRNINVGCIMK